MKDTASVEQRLAALEGELALLKQHDAHRQAEHTSLLEFVAKSREGVVREVDETMGLQSRWLDERLAGLASRVRIGTGDAVDLSAIFRAYTTDMIQFVKAMIDKNNDAMVAALGRVLGAATGDRKEQP